jgi:hypothetical protein
MMARQLGCGQVPPRLFLHEFLKPREEIKKNLQARKVFEYQCSPSKRRLITSIVHPSFTSWWQEFHDHIFNEPVHSFCLELIPDFQPISEVMYLFFLFSIMSFFTDHDPLPLLCRIQCLPLELGQYLTMLQAQSLLWDLIPQLWLN